MFTKTLMMTKLVAYNYRIIAAKEIISNECLLIINNLWTMFPFIYMSMRNSEDVTEFLAKLQV